MAVSVSDLAITSLETITFFDVTTGDYMFTLDELQNATIAQTEDSTDITGKNGRRIASLKRNKAVTISGTNGIVSGGLLELQTGGTFTGGATKVMWADYLTVNASHQATTSYVAVGTAGAEIESLIVKASDGTVAATLVQDSTASAGKFAYDPSTKKLTFHTDIAEGTEIVAYYKRNINANTLTNLSGNYSGKAALYVDAFAEDKCGKTYRVQFYLPKVSFNGNFSIEFSDSQVTHGFEATAQSSACSGAGGDTYFTYTVFDSNAADVAVSG